MKKRARGIMMAIAVVVLLSMVLAGCTKSVDKATESGEGNEAEVIKIGVFEPLTGENAGGGQQELSAIQYANEIYPEVLGKKVELVIVDNKSDKAEAEMAVKKLIEEDGVTAIIGSYGSGVSIAAGNIIQAAGVPTIGTSCTNPMVTKDNPYYFRVCYIDPFQGTVMANYSIQNGAKTAAVITQRNDDYSTGLGSYFEKSFKLLTGDEKAIVCSKQFDTNQQDFTAILTDVKAANPDVIFAPSSVVTAPVLIKQIRERGITCPIMGGDTWENVAIIQAAGVDAEGIALSTFFDENIDTVTEEAEKFLSGYKEKLGENEPNIPAVAALSYDAYIVLLDAIARAGSVEKEAIRTALTQTKNFAGVTGIINFNEHGDAQKNVAVIKLIRGNEFIYLDTVTVAPTGE